MKLILFSGFLGAGKTVSILSASAYLLRRFPHDNGTAGAAGQVPLVILENEIGEAPYDESLLRSQGLEIRNLLSGCICCTLSLDLVGELRWIEERYAPRVVVFEPTGMAFPDRILETLHRADVVLEGETVVTLVDTTRFDRLLRIVPHLVKSQIACANTILLSKTDLISETETEEIRSCVREINPEASIRVAPFGLAPEDADAFWKEVFETDGK
jgi:G3E family GTPase